MSKEVIIRMDRARAEIMKREHNLDTDDQLWWLCFRWSKINVGDKFQLKVKEEDGKMVDLFDSIPTIKPKMKEIEAERSSND